MVYRLSGSGTTKEDVIAKRSLKQYFEVERAIYESILSDLPISSLRYYGSIEDEDPDYGWLFIEDADGRPYNSQSKAHRISAGCWLGTLHTSSAYHQVLSKLPDRGPGYYLERLRSARHWIERTLNFELKIDERDSIQTIVSYFERLEGQWNQLLNFCERLPRTVVHGDFSTRNIRIRGSVPRITLVSFDWGEAGRGVPPVDILGRFSHHRGSHSVEPDIHAYWLVARKIWSIPDIETIRKFESVGKTFRAISAFAWDVPSATGRVPEEPGLTKTDFIRNLGNWRVYGGWLAESLEEIRSF